MRCCLVQGDVWLATTVLWHGQPGGRAGRAPDARRAGGRDVVVGGRWLLLLLRGVVLCWLFYRTDGTDVDLFATVKLWLGKYRHVWI